MNNTHPKIPTGQSEIPALSIALALLLSGCGSVPVPAPIWVWDRSAPAEASVAEAADAPALEPEVVPSTSASQASLPGDAVPDTQQPEQQVVSNVPELKTARDYWRYAVTRLQVGDVANARIALDRALVISPRNKVAHKLLRQLEIDPVQELGEKHFMYTVAQGESLSRIAKDYLNDSLKFYLLARYNGIDNPDNMKIGQQIKIPGEAPVVLAKPAKKKNPVLEQARVAYSEESYEQVIEQLQPVLAKKKARKTWGRDFVPMQELLISAYTGAAQNQLEAGDFSGALDMLKQAQALDANHLVVKEMLGKLDSEQDLASWYAQALELKPDDPEQSHKLFDQIRAVNPDYRDVVAQLKSLNTDIAAFYYREALKKQRSQQLDDAIVLWDKLLALDPDNENARLYRARAVELKVNLQKFVSDQ